MKKIVKIFTMFFALLVTFGLVNTVSKVKARQRKMLKVILMVQRELK